MSSARSRARRLAMQGLYEWAMSGNEPTAIARELIETTQQSKLDEEFFQELILNVPKNIEQLDENIKPYISRSLDDIDPVELAILRVSAYEFLFRFDIPYRVIINEAIELAKRFGAEDSHKFINGTLDKLAKHSRSAEIKQKQSL